MQFALLLVLCLSTQLPGVFSDGCTVKSLGTPPSNCLDPGKSYNTCKMEMGCGVFDWECPTGYTQVEEKDCDCLVFSCFHKNEVCERRQLVNNGLCLQCKPGYELANGGKSCKLTPSPTSSPTSSPTTRAPTTTPTSSPTSASPTTPDPTLGPTPSPTTAAPTLAPTVESAKAMITVEDSASNTFESFSDEPEEKKKKTWIGALVGTLATLAALIMLMFCCFITNKKKDDDNDDDLDNIVSANHQMPPDAVGRNMGEGTYVFDGVGEGGTDNTKGLGEEEIDNLETGGTEGQLREWGTIANV